MLSAWTVAAWGSQPGQPLDCSDWTFLEPGFSCSDWIAYPCGGEAGEVDCMGGQEAMLDNQGRELRIRFGGNTGVSCGSASPINRISLSVFNGVTETLI